MLLPTFSPTELQLLENQAFFHTKASANDKIQLLLNEVKNQLLGTIGKHEIAWPEGVDVVHGKLTRGENYLMRPWMVLDFPKLLDHDSIFAFRTLHWWGNGFSCTLQLHGDALEQCRGALIQNTLDLSGRGFFSCVNTNPWEHHDGLDNYRSVESFGDGGLQQHFRERTFIKLMRKLPVERYLELPTFAESSLVQVLKATGCMKS
jgi:hypothetical protein